MLNIHLQTLLVLVVSIRTSQTFTCPQPSTWYRAAEYFCPRSADYHCLYNGLTEYYQQFCIIAERFPAGSYVLYEGSLNTKRCPPVRYQPKPYLTSLVNECIYQKSMCIGEGLVIHENGTTGSDRTCRCDYRRGYDFVTKPKNLCFCIPSEEDCSCYLKQCPDNKNRLTPDYECKGTDGLISCPVIRFEETSTNQGHDKPGKTIHSDENTIIIRSVDTFFVARIVTGLVCLMIVVFVVIFGAVMFIEGGEPDSILQAVMYTKGSGPDAALQALLDRSYNHYQKKMRDDIVGDINTFRHAETATENNHIVILKGRQGTGKSTLALYLASIYMKQKYKLAILDRDDSDTLADIQRSSESFVIILEEWFDASDTNTTTAKLQSDVLDSHNFQNDFEIIVTATYLDENRLEKLRLNGIVTGNNVINLDVQSPEHIKDNQSIMRCLLTKYNRELSDDVIKEAAETNTYYGFPLQCVLFCQDSRKFELGSKYFRQPPVVLMDTINELKSSEKQQDRIMYCVLVYIILNPETGLLINDLDMQNISSIFKEGYSTSFWERSFSEKGVKDACRELHYKDLLLTGNNLYFLPPVVYQAVMLSYADACFDKIIERCDLRQLLDIVRPLTYEKLEGEVVLIIDRKKTDSAIDSLAKRMVLACLDDEAAIPRIVQYIRRCKFAHVLQKTIGHLETKLKTLTTDKRIENVMILMEGMTSNGSMELLDYTPTTFVLTWTLMALRKSGQTDIIEGLVDRFIRRKNKTISIEILRTVVDQHNNSFLHYCVLWWHNKDNPFIRYLENEFQKKFDEWVKYTDAIFEITNKKDQMSAVDFAAYFGNHELLERFIRFKIKRAMSQTLPKAKVAKVLKEVNKLLEYTENGKTNNIIRSYSSCPFINMTLCGPIDVNDTFNYDKAAAVLTSIKQKS